MLLLRKMMKRLNLGRLKQVLPCKVFDETSNDVLQQNKSITKQRQHQHQQMCK